MKTNADTKLIIALIFFIIVLLQPTHNFIFYIAMFNVFINLIATIILVFKK